MVAMMISPDYLRQVRLEQLDTGPVDFFKWSCKEKWELMNTMTHLRNCTKVIHWGTVITRCNISRITLYTASLHTALQHKYTQPCPERTMSAVVCILRCMGVWKLVGCVYGEVMIYSSAITGRNSPPAVSGFWYFCWCWLRCWPCYNGSAMYFLKWNIWNIVIQITRNSEV